MTLNRVYLHTLGDFDFMLCKNNSLKVLLQQEFS